MKTPLLATLLVTSLLPAPALAWGDKGHEIIAAIARDRLTPQAGAWVAGILSKDSDTLTASDMISRATWADKWRDSGHRETASWHFVDQELKSPDQKSACFGYPQPASPPSAGPPQDCVVDKLNEFEAELTAPATPDAERILALKYVLHFVGDIHQPLHASDNQDRGGNCVFVSNDGLPTNLHAYWDTGVLAPLTGSLASIAASLEQEISAEAAGSWSAGDPASWARESYEIAKSDVYTLRSSAGCERSNGSIDLSAKYRAGAFRTAKLQLEKAGVRLAWVLNAAAAAVPTH